MNILGISALYHDSAATLCCDDMIVCAAQEERFTRVKGDSSFPVNAVNYCLSMMEGKLDVVAYYDNPLLSLDRFLNNLVDIPHKEFVISKISDKLFGQRLAIDHHLRKYLSSLGIDYDVKIMVCKHHISHAASAFFPSPYESAAILVNDGVGEWSTTSLGIGTGNSIRILKELHYPDSLGMLYSAFTAFCGFKVNYGEYKLMGLAPYGNPIWKDFIFDNIVHLKDDGSFVLAPDFFEFREYGKMYSNRFSEFFGVPPRTPESAITKEYTDIAASIQAVVDEIVTRQCIHLRELTGCDCLVMAGGCALNCVTNGVIARRGIFKKIWIQPAANDAGGSLGAALYSYYHFSNSPRVPNPLDSQRGSLLGPEFSHRDIQQVLDDFNLRYVYLDDERLVKSIVDAIMASKVIGLFNGRMEFGPRALGCRSIIASAIDKDMQSRVNLKIKFRESFRPFAPAVLEEDSSTYFEGEYTNPYMVFVTHVRNDLRLPLRFDPTVDIISKIKCRNSLIPAVTHVDYSSRVQTVDAVRNPFLYRLLKCYKRVTGVGIVLNTSFNVRGEPIVCYPKDAIECFLKTDMDVLAIGNFIIYKHECKKQQNNL